MQIFVDADACPVVDIVEKIAKEYNVPVILLYDTNHVLASNYSEVIVSVAAMALGKDTYTIHQSGKWYTNDNIGQMLMGRHLDRKTEEVPIKIISRDRKSGHRKMIKDLHSFLKKCFDDADYM